MSLVLSVNNENGEIEFKTQGKTNIEDYLYVQTRSTLRNLRFNTETFKKQIPKSVQ